ncbi:MAG: PH domain-containing protein [Calditrichota bacterium]
MNTIRLSKTTLTFWRTLLWTWVGICFLAGLAAWLIPYALSNSLQELLFLPVGVLAIGILSHLYLTAFWRRFNFTYDERHISIFSGIWWRKQVLIPFNRITNIDVIQGPWQRSRGLATLKLQTAGQRATNVAESQLWSIYEFEALRDDLQQKALSARQQTVTDGTGAVEADAINGDAFKQMLDLLSKIEENTRPRS